MDTKKNILIFIFSVIGLFLSLWLCKIYYDVNFNPYAFSSFCSVNDFIDCDGVAKTDYSQFAGIPLSLWGVCFYCFIIYLLFTPKLSKLRLLKFSEVFKNPTSYIFCLSLLAFIISVSLAFISIFEINKICVLCFTTYFIDLGIAITAKDFSKSCLYEIKNSISDFLDAIKIKGYFIAFLIVFFSFIGILIYMSQSKILTPQLNKLSEFKVELSGIYNNQNALGDKNARLIVHEYIDYNCASCYLTNLSLKRLAVELKDLLIIQHNMPLDAECNRLVTNGHEGSCRMARYALAAKKQGKYWEANEILFDKTPKSEKEIIKLLSHINGIDKKKLKTDANSEEIKNELNSEIEDALAKQIDGTPTLIINLEKHTGNIPYNKLKEKLIEAGASEKGDK